MFLASAMKTRQRLWNTTGKKIFDKTEKFRRCFKPLHTTNETSSETLAGRTGEANELRWRRNKEFHAGWEDTELTSNGRMLLQNTVTKSNEYRMLKALFVKSLGRKKFLINNMGNARSLSRAHHDF